MHTVKATTRTIRTSVQAAKTAARTTQATAKISIRAAQAAAKAATPAIKLLAKAAVATVKAVAVAIKSLIVAIAAGGWIVLVIVIVVGAILFNPAFGLFYSNEQTGDTNTIPMSQAVAEVSGDFSVYVVQQIFNASAGHDNVTVVYDSGIDGDIDSVNNWVEVLGFRQQIEHERLKQRRLALFPKRFRRLRALGCGVADQVVDELYHVLFVSNIPEWIIAV